MKSAPSKKPPHLAAAKVARLPPTREELGGVFEELQGASDRAAGILAAAHLEVELERLLAEHFVEMSEGDAHMLFGPQGGVLSSAMAKVRLGHAMGLFGNHTRDACATIFEIRNLLAHAPRTVSFSTNAIKNKCDQMNIMDVYEQSGLWPLDDAKYSNTKEKFVFSVYGIILLIEHTILEHKKQQSSQMLAALDKFREQIQNFPREREQMKAALDRLSMPEASKPPLP